MGKDYYDVLGISKSSSKEDIKKAYKKMAKKYHPDISKEVNASEKFKEVSEAYEVLNNDSKKSQYDTYGSTDGSQGFGGGSSQGHGGGFSQGFNNSDFGVDIEDIFESFGFGGGSRGGSQQRQKHQVEKLVYGLVVDLDTVYFGAKKDLTIKREVSCEDCLGNGYKNSSDVSDCSYCEGSGVIEVIQRSFLGSIKTHKHCPKCNGEGKKIKNPCNSCSGKGCKSKSEKVSISVPKGVEEGLTLRVQDYGNYNKNTKSYEDLYLKISVNIPNDIEIDGFDIYKEMKINFIQAILGDEISFKHFDKELSLKVPQGTQFDTTLRIKDKGLPYMDYDEKGDLYIKLNIEIPKKVNKEQKNLLIDYAKTLGDKSFFSRIKSFF